MTFLPTIDLWDNYSQAALRSGALRLQPGQWVRCGAGNDHAAMFAGVTRGGSIYVAHWQGSRKATLARYHHLREVLS